MGEANPEGLAQIKEITGHAPGLWIDQEGIQLLRIGEVVIPAKGFALWSDPTVYIRSDNEFTLSWGGSSANFLRDANGNWTADVKASLLTGPARWIDCNIPIQEARRYQNRTWFEQPCLSFETTSLRGMASSCFG